VHEGCILNRGHALPIAVSYLIKEAIELRIIFTKIFGTADFDRKSLLSRFGNSTRRVASIGTLFPLTAL
jgi:hypothetical protein